SIYHAFTMTDVILEFWSEMLDETQHWSRRCITERTYGPSGNIATNIREQIQILHATLPFDDTLYDTVKPSSSFPTRRTLPARFLKKEIRQPLECLYHASGFVHDDRRTCT